MLSARVETHIRPACFAPGTSSTHCCLKVPTGPGIPNTCLPKETASNAVLVFYIKTNLPQSYSCLQFWSNAPYVTFIHRQFHFEPSLPLFNTLAAVFCLSGCLAPHVSQQKTFSSFVPTAPHSQHSVLIPPANTSTSLIDRSQHF